MTEITAHHGIFKDTKLHVDDTGDGGRPVVLIHGWPLTGESWNDRIPALQAAGHRVVAGEVARYFTEYGAERVRSAVVAAAVPPYMEQASDNPEGPLTKNQAAAMTASLTTDQDSVYDDFVTRFFRVLIEFVAT
ncbi:alpha/beta fold hydrolase [Conexibacter sp. CPCC 206217]|uniref:alpha/beta fold hydrolase n=1 Tax=Conexibacter sp. CPCC 206217 TaxID=3064574 RepID=UPI002724A455|nr:hypothetical protein [Conexibacter sp. CPCC 206217]MDO8208847.1 hypothetical protein [Conexibacter sp. CPCC 206217]